MSKNRYINTHFWDDQFIQELEPKEKLLFLYLLTNPLTNIAGIYEITFSRIMFDTGLDRAFINKAFARLSEASKVFYELGYVMIRNFKKHQSFNSNMERGYSEIIKKLPEELKACEGFKRLSNPSKYLIKLNTNSNTNLNSNLSSEPSAPKKAEKQSYSEFVFMTSEEYGKLLDEYGPSKTQEMIDRLNDYIGSKGAKYRSHYHTIKNWIRKDGPQMGLKLSKGGAEKLNILANVKAIREAQKG